MKTAKEMLANIEMMEQSRDKLLKAAQELRSTYGEGVEKDALTLEGLAAQTEELIEQGYGDRQAQVQRLEKTAGRRKTEYNRDTGERTCSVRDVEKTFLTVP